MNYASKSGWSSIREMNSPCNLISYGSLLCWAAESNCPWKEIYLQYVLAVWNGIAIWSAHAATPPLQRHRPSHTHLPTQASPHQALSTSPLGFSRSHVCRLQKQQKKRSRLLTVFWRWSVVRITESPGCLLMPSAGKSKRLAISLLSEKKAIENANDGSKNNIYGLAPGVTSHSTDIIVIKT